MSDSGSTPLAKPERTGNNIPAELPDGVTLEDAERITELADCGPPTAALPKNST